MRAELAYLLSQAGLSPKAIAKTIRHIQDWQDGIEAELRVTQIVCALLAFAALGGYFFW